MDSVLRDIDRERSKMQTDVENLYRHYEKLAGYVRQHIEQATVEWARLVASHPKALLLVMETTRVVDESGYAAGDSEPIRLTALPLENSEVWDQLLRPTHSRGVLGAEYHGLTLADLEGQPYLADAWPNIWEQLENRHVIIFGADWARNALRAVHHTHVLDDAVCLHNKCKEYYGEFYDLSLEKILSYQGIDKKREDLRDSRDRILMLAQIVRNLAAGMIKQPEVSEDLLSNLDSHPF